MNGKKAKMLRRQGKVAKKVKKMYNSLSSVDRGTLREIYEFKESRDALAEKK